MEDHVRTLERIIKRRVADFGVPVLKRAAALKDQVIQTWITRDDEIVIGRPPLKEVISCEPIRQLAQRELSRRGTDPPGTTTLT